MSDLLETVTTKLKSIPLAELHEIAAQTGFSEGGIRKIRYGEVPSPRYKTLVAIEGYFSQKRRKKAA